MQFPGILRTGEAARVISSKNIKVVSINTYMRIRVAILSFSLKYEQGLKKPYKTSTLGRNLERILKSLERLMRLILCPPINALRVWGNTSYSAPSSLSKEDYVNVSNRSH